MSDEKSGVFENETELAENNTESVSENNSTENAEEQAAAGETELTLTDEELLELCRKRVCEGCDVKKEADDERLRNLAEMDNFRKRMQRDQEEFRKYAAENVLADILPVMDNLELALTHGRKVEACKDLVMGVEMTLKGFLEALGRHGLNPVGKPGEEFDPNFHEAVGNEERTDIDPNLVGTVLQTGYILNDRLLRPAKVMVTKAPE